MKVVTIPVFLLAAMSMSPVSADERIGLGRRPLGEESRPARTVEGRPGARRRRGVPSPPDLANLHCAFCAFKRR